MLLLWCPGGRDHVAWMSWGRSVRCRSADFISGGRTSECRLWKWVCYLDYSCPPRPEGCSCLLVHSLLSGVFPESFFPPKSPSNNSYIKLKHGPVAVPTRTATVQEEALTVTTIVAFFISSCSCCCHPASIPQSQGRNWLLCWMSSMSGAACNKRQTVCKVARSTFSTRQVIFLKWCTTSWSDEAVHLLFRFTAAVICLTNLSHI